ncbi:unnamed protein product [Penicillium palitans]
MARQSNAIQALGICYLGNLPQELVLSIASIMTIRERCRLSQTCKPLHSLLADDIMKWRQLHVRILAPREVYEKIGWRWRSPYKIAGLNRPNKWGNGCFVQSSKPKKSEILACAIWRGDFEAVRKYLRSGVDPNLYSTAGGYMLHVAVQANQPGMVTLLLEYGANPHSLHITKGIAPYYLAFHFEYHPGLIIAFARGGNIDCFVNDIAFHCTYGVVQACIDAGIDFNQTSSDGETVAHTLAQRNDLGMFRIMVPHLTIATLTKASNIHETPLDVAMKQSSTQLAMEFILAGADINRSIGTTIFTAVKTGHFKIARMILDRNTDLFLEKYTGMCGLAVGISACDVGIIRTLIHRGASKERDEHDCTSPLICAVRTEKLEIVKLIYEEGSNHPSLRYNPGKLFSPSLYATALTLGNPEITEYLEDCINCDDSGSQIPCIPESDAHSDLARKIMEIMSNLHRWDECIFDEPVKSNPNPSPNPSLVHEIALHILPLAGANFDSSRICDLVSYPSMYALVEAMKGLELSKEEKETGEGEDTDPDNTGLLGKAFPRLLRVARKEVDPERRALFLETLKDVCMEHITTQSKAQMHADTKILETTLLPPGMNDRVRQVKEILTRLCALAKENVDDDEMDRLMVIFLRVLRC